MVDSAGRSASGFGALASPRPIAIGQLRYREDSLGIVFRPLLAGHRVKQAQIVTFYGEAATPRLEVADGAMPVKNERRRLPTAAGRRDRFDDLASLGHVLPDLQGFCGGAPRRRSVFRCLPISRWPATVQVHRNTPLGCRKRLACPGARAKRGQRCGMVLISAVGGFRVCAAAAQSHRRPFRSRHHA